MESSPLHSRVILAATGLLALAPLAALPAYAASGGDRAVTTEAQYVKANGSPITPGDAIQYCGANKRQQNEPTAAIDPTMTNVITSGSNDYCTVEGNGSTWAGFSRSSDGGDTFVQSLLPGYPTDDSPEGQASPLHKAGITNAGDPVQAWDTHGRLFFMGNAFNRTQPQNGAVWVATYDQHAAHYARTVIVAKGAPAFNG